MSERRMQFQSLVDLARQEPTPPVGVADRVAERIERNKTRLENDWPTWPAVGLSVAAAMMMMAFLMQEGISWSDPFGDWLSSLTLVMS